MNVISIRPRGYCKGVTKAIQAVRNAVNDPNIQKPVHVLGYIVHNRHVIDELDHLGVITHDDFGKNRIDLVDDIDQGTVVLSAHGTEQAVKARLKEKGLPFIDATCEDVLKTFQLIKEHSEGQEHILYIGRQGHPEAKAALSLAERMTLVSTIEDIPKDIDRPIFVTNQTTFSMTEIEPIIAAIVERYPNTLISEEICSATRLRQTAVIEQNKGVDLCYVVGDTRSNNTKNLAIISETITKTKTRMIDNVKDIDPLDLVGVTTVSVTSGASTPGHLTSEVIDFLKNYDNAK